MPLSSGMSIHDDTKHKGSAKRDVVGGVAGVNGSGNVLAVGSTLRLSRDVGNDIFIEERTSGEGAFWIHRHGANDYTLWLKVAASYSAIQTATMKDAANGIAGLDADVKVVADLMPLPMLTVAQFQANAATGTADDPSWANDTLLPGAVKFDAIGEYVEVQFDHYNFITKYRMYGKDVNNEDGAYKIQHYEDGGWVDNTLNIPTNLSVWSSWALLDIPVYTKAIRLVATSIDSTFGISSLGEIEIEG